MPRTIAVWSESGGDGKTTLAANTGAAIGRKDHRVLLIDMDPQPASLTQHVGLGHLKDADGDHLGDVLLDDETRMDELIVELDDFDIVPAHEDLAFFDRHVTNENIRLPEFRLREEIEALADEYDYFIVDCPASLGVLVDNALVATRNVLMPVQLTEKGRVSIEGLEETVDALEGGIQQVQDDFDLSILGLVPNMVRDSNIYDETQQELEDDGRLVAPVHIRQRDVLKKAWKEHQTIFEYADENDLRPYEEDVLDNFDTLGKLITGEYRLTITGDGSIEIERPMQETHTV